MVKASRAGLFCYCLAATTFWLCHAAQAQHVPNAERQRDRLRQHQDHSRYAPSDYGFGVNVAPPPDLIWNHKQPGGASAPASEGSAR